MRHAWAPVLLKGERLAHVTGHNINTFVKLIFQSQSSSNKVTEQPNCRHVDCRYKNTCWEASWALLKRFGLVMPLLAGTKRPHTSRCGSLQKTGALTWTPKWQGSCYTDTHKKDPQGMETAKAGAPCKTEGHEVWFCLAIGCPVTISPKGSKYPNN